MTSELPTLTIKMISEQTGLTQKRVRRLVASGEIKSSLVGGVYLVSPLALTKFLKIQRKTIGFKQTDLWGNEVELRLPKKKGRPTYKRNHEDKVTWVDIRSEFSQKRLPPSSLTYVDLFCGMGGLSKGLEMAGLEGLCGLDWFPEAGMTYKRNFHHAYVEGDIKKRSKKLEFYQIVKSKLGKRKLGIVAGGFPCVGFSLSGNRIVDDPRNSLYKELLAIVKKLKPQFVLCENVVGLRSMLDGKVEEKILSDFTRAGYAMSVTVLRAADYGVPQKRDRVIFIGNRINKTNVYPKPILKPNEYRTIKDAIEDLVNAKMDPKFNHVATKHRLDMVARMKKLPEGKSLYEGYSDSWKRSPWNEPSCTIKENHGAVNVHPKLPRVLTAREMARIQSFEDTFILEGSKNKQLVQLGNAVPPLLAKAIGIAIRKALDEL